MRARFANKKPELSAFPKARFRTSGRTCLLSSAQGPLRIPGDSAIFPGMPFSLTSANRGPQSFQRSYALHGRASAWDEPIRRNHELKRFADHGPVTTWQKQWLALVGRQTGVCRPRDRWAEKRCLPVNDARFALLRRSQSCLVGAGAEASQQRPASTVLTAVGQDLCRPVPRYAKPGIMLATGIFSQSVIPPFPNLHEVRAELSTFMNVCFLTRSRISRSTP